MGENARVEIGHARVKTCDVKISACRNLLDLLKGKVDSLSARFKHPRVSNKLNLF